MFLGHYAVALAAKKAAPRTSLGTLFAAAQFVDLLWPLLVLLGIEHVRIEPGNTAVTPLDFVDYPISHSLAGALLWAALGAGAYFAVRRQARGAVVVGLCVLSHWILDFISHRPDLPLWFTGTTKVGAGLWNSVPATMVVEGGLFVAGTALYLGATRANDTIGKVALWALLGVLAAIGVMNYFSPPPPDAMAVAVVANAAWLFVFWAFWADRHRGVVHNPPQPAESSV
jgi:hypothetical protein